MGVQSKQINSGGSKCVCVGGGLQGVPESPYFWQIDAFWQYQGALHVKLPKMLWPLKLLDPPPPTMCLESRKSLYFMQITPPPFLNPGTVTDKVQGGSNRLLYKCSFSITTEVIQGINLPILPGISLMRYVQQKLSYTQFVYNMSPICVAFSCSAWWVYIN